MTTLEAISRILVSAQLNAVASLSSPDANTTKAISLLDSERKRVLELGWDFNQDYNYPLTAVAGIISVPTTPWVALNVDVQPYNSYRDIVVRDGKLYDKTNRTFTFSETSINVDVTWLVDFDTLPLVAQEYLVACTSVKFAVQVSVDPDVARQLRLDEMRAWFALKQRDTTQSSASHLNRHPTAQIAQNWPKIRTF